MPNSGGITTGEASGVTEPPLAAAVSGEIMDGRASHDSNNKERPLDDPINSTLAGDYGANGSNSPMSADTLPQTAPLPPSHTSLRSIGSTKRPSPIKYGYLFKQSSGKWKRKRWNQRWFVLDYDTGALKYFRNASMPQAIPFRQDAHGMMQLKDPNVSLVIQSDLPRGIPTPFCFILADGNRQFIICADSNQEFREWTSAISVILSPRKATTDASSSTVVRNMPSMSSSMSIRSVETTEPVTTSTYSADQTTETADGKPSAASTPPVDKSSIPVKGISNNVQAPTPVNDSFLSTPRQAAKALLLVNPLVAVIRYGSIELLYVALFAVNVALVWLLWMRNAMLTASLSDSNSAEDKVRGDSAPSSTSPPKGRLSLDEGKKDHGILRHIRLPTSASTEDIIPHKFQGIVNGIQAKAGASVPMCPSSPAEIVVGCWCHISGSRFNVRQGPNYRKTKLKAPSDESLLHLVAIDVYRSSGKIDNIASLVDLSSLQRDLPLDLFIVNCQVPSYAPSNPLWGEKQGDGVGFNFVTYFAIPPDVRTLLNMDHPDHQAVRLLKEFMQESSTMHDRFKAIGIVVNPKEQNLGRTERHLLETYNGQPILTRPQHRFYRGANYFEVDVDAHEFNYVARKGLGGVSDHFRNMIVDFGFVLEGQEDDELPEQVLGGVRLGKIDVRHVPEIF